jgi:hypothetical protein
VDRAKTPSRRWRSRRFRIITLPPPMVTTTRPGTLFLPVASAVGSQQILGSSVTGGIEFTPGNDYERQSTANGHGYGRNHREHTDRTSRFGDLDPRERGGEWKISNIAVQRISKSVTEEQV